MALSGKKVLHAKAGDTGMFDTLKGDYDGIILDDCVCDNPLGLSDNYVCRVYRRNRNSPPWTGQYFIVLSNLPFETWLEKCGVTDEENVKAAYDRAYLCAVKFREDGVKYLSLKKLSTRGKKEDQMARVDMFMDFQKKFNESIAQYNPKDEMVDYTELIDPEYWTRTQKARMAENAALKSQGIHLHSVYDNNTERSYALRSFGEWFWSDPDYSPWVAYVKSKRIHGEERSKD